MMQFKNLKIQQQTKILLSLIAGGFFIICVTTLLALNGLKFDYNKTLAKKAHKRSFLHNVGAFYTSLPFYNDNTTFYTNYELMLIDWENYKHFTQQTNILSTIQTIYQNLFVTQKITDINNLESSEKEIIESIDYVIAQTPNIWKKIAYSPKDSRAELILHALFLRHQMDAIFPLQNKTALIEEEITDSIYSATLWVLYVFIVFVSIVTLYFASLILRFIKDINLELQQTINTQTKHLAQTNANLEQTIQSEIEQSRKKDQIMYQQARLASMGEMIQNIAHQWRQPLNSLIVLIQSFKLKYQSNKLTSEFVENQTEDALRIAKNMSDTIENFRNFFQPNIGKATFFVAKSIDDSIGLIYPTLQQNNIQIFFSKKDDIEIYGHENAFSQVVLNLIKNSQDAFLERNIEGGIIEIALQKEQKEAYLYIMDNGGGIEIKDIDKIFEPYFTTKHKSVGTGIGLYMVKQIVEKQMNGIIKVKNQEWQSFILNRNFYGAIFMIEFPI